MEMQAFGLSVTRAIRELDYVHSINGRVLEREAKLVRTVHVVAALFVYFLEIHPYANGNGHMARLLVIALFGRHDLFVNSRWDLHPRPAEPQYTQAIASYRNNDKAPLHKLLFECL